MKTEIKEIDITKDLYLCSPLLNTECSKENCYINNGPCCHTVNKEHSQQYLLDYITNLQEELKYSVPQVQHNQIVSKLAKEKHNLQQELERYKNIINTVRNCILTDISMLKTRRPEMSKEEIIMRLEATVKSLDKLKELKGE